MAIYDTGTASLAANGRVTGVGTQWTMPLTLIRVGATIIFKTNPLKIYTISEITSDTSISVYNPKNETIPTSTGYAILAHDGISVQGLAQNVAETLRYYQSKETSIQSLLDFIGQDSFDWPRFEQLANQSVQGAAEALASQIAAAESAETAVSARDETTAARDATIAAINSAGDAGTMVTLAGMGISGTTPLLTSLDWNTFNFNSGSRYLCAVSSMTNAPEVITTSFPQNAICIIEVKSSRGVNGQKNFQVSANTSSDNTYRVLDINQVISGDSRSYTSREALYVPAGGDVGGANAQRVRGLIDVYSKPEVDQKVPVSFESGGTITSKDQIAIYLNGDYASYYNWTGGLPKTIPAGSTPETSGGVGDGAWLSLEGFILSKMEVTAESIGVVSGAVSQSVAKSNADIIIAKAEELSSMGGGKIIFTKSLYQVHMDESDFSSSAATLRVAALCIPYSNVILEGQGWDSTVIQAWATNSAYGVLQWAKAPLQNGVTKVYGVGLHNICIDGNYQGDFTPSSYVRQTEGVVGAGIEGLSINNLKVKNCSHYGMGLQNGGYKGCSIDGYWSENTGGDGLDIKDNRSVSRAFKINNVTVLNFGQLDEPANPWAGLDVMSLAPQVSNVFVSDFGDKGQPGAGVRLKQGPIGDLNSRGTAAAWANVSNITVIQNRFKGTVSDTIGLHIKAPHVNYSNIACYGDGGKIGIGVWIEERYCHGVNVQLAHVNDGYQTTSASGPSDRVYGDAESCTVTGITVMDTSRALILNRKYQKLNNVILKDCPVGFVSGGSNSGKVVVRGLHLDNVDNPFGLLTHTFQSISDVTGPSSVGWQAGVSVIKGSSNFAATAINSVNSVRIYSDSTEDSLGTEVARFASSSCNLYSSLVVDGNITPSAANTRYIGTSSTPWSGGFSQSAFTVTSDEQSKSRPLEITDAILDAAAEVDFVQYQYIDRIIEKGDDGARWHFGTVAQRYAEAFERHGLSAHDFAFFCYDEWGAKDAVINEETGVVESPAIEAGCRYGLRYEEALVMEAALQRRNHERCLAKIKELDSRLSALGG